MYVASLCILVVSGVLYQVFQKQIAPTANPALSLIVCYLTALPLSGLLLFLFPVRKTLAGSIGELNSYSLLLALPIVGIELGYLLLYRNGGKLSFSSSLVGSLVTVSLVLVGVALFREHLSVKKLLGIAFCLTGVFLLNVK